MAHDDRSLPAVMTSDAAYVQGRLPLARARFDDPEEFRSVWGRPWGASTEVGQLRRVMLRRPGPEFNDVDTSVWDDDLGAAVDPGGRWYWMQPEGPDLARMQAQHDHLVETLESYGVETEVLAPLSKGYTKSIYMRDPLVTVKGGAVIGRLAPQMRRGEEAEVTLSIAALGMPILGTITGGGFVEGGSLVKVTPQLALFGTSIRCNSEGASQLSDILKYHGITVVSVPLSGFEFHLDGTLAMIDVDRALVSPETAPHWFPDLLREHGVQPIWAPVDEGWAVNGLTIAPGHVLLSSSAPKTAEMLDAIGVKVDVIDYDAVQANGGGIHCSTIELLRDDV